MNERTRFGLPETETLLHCATLSLNNGVYVLLFILAAINRCTCKTQPRQKHQGKQ